MPVLVKVELAKADVPNANGRVYSTALLRKVAEQTQDGFIPVAPSSCKADLKDIMGVLVDANVRNNALCATLRLLDTENGRSMQEILKSGYKGCFCMSGRGTVGEGGVVQDDYVMESVTLDWPHMMKDQRLRQILLKKFKSRHDLSRTAEDPSGSAVSV